MDMRLQHTTLNLETPCGSCRSQITVEGEVTLPGSLREAANVLHASAMAVVESAEAMQDRVSIGGRVTFCVLYTQGERRKVESIEATADYTHLCELAGASARDDVFAAAQVEHVYASVQNGRMTMRAMVTLGARVTHCEGVEALTGIDVPDAEVKMAQVKYRRTVGRGASDVLLREEFALPPELAIHDTLGAWARTDFYDATGGQGRIGLSGEVTIEAIHASDLPGKPLVTTRHTVPVNQAVELTGEGGDLIDGRMTVKDVAVVSLDMGDGERTLRAEVLLGLSAWADRAEEAAVLSDAYTITGDDLRLTAAPLTIRTADRRMHAAESGKAALILPEGAKPVRTMIAAFATPVLTRFIQQGSRMIVEGVLETTMLYMSEEGDSPVSLGMEAPFRTAFAAEAAPEDVITLEAANVEAIPITSDRVELRYILHAQVDGMQTETVSFATDAAAVPAGDVTNDIVLYFTQPGETAWDIVRRYRIPESEMRALNPDLTGEPKVGQAIVLWRKNIV